MTGFSFPFGNKVSRVEQADRSPKPYFVLGVYASAVHARWLDAGGNVFVKALAVASEPSVFWTGDGADEIVRSIDVPAEAGSLVAASPEFNGPSGRSLDEHYLAPLGLTRSHVWCCDLLPESRMNEGQRGAIERDYQPLVDRGIVEPVTVPVVPKAFVDDARRQEIVDEIIQSEAKVLITLGDLPLRELVGSFGGRKSLALYGTALDEYGRHHEVVVGGRSIELLPLVHPRQAAGMKPSSSRWKSLHSEWIERSKVV